MTLTLDLPRKLENELRAEAERFGLSLSEYALRVLSTGRALSSLPRTGAELVAYWESEGLIGSRPDIADSQEHARAIRRQAEHRARE